MTHHHADAVLPPRLEESFSIQQAFTSAWGIFVEHWNLLISIQLVVHVLMWLAQVCVDGTYPWTLARLSATVLMLGLALIMGLGVMFVSLRLYDGKPTQLLDIFDPLPLFWGYAGVMIIYMLAVLVGLSVLILPGVVLASGFVLAVFIVLETNADPVLALMQSWRLTRGHKLNIAVFIGCSMFQ